MQEYFTVIEKMLPANWSLTCSHLNINCRKQYFKIFFYIFWEKVRLESSFKLLLKWQALFPEKKKKKVYWYVRGHAKEVYWVIILG